MTRESATRIEAERIFLAFQEAGAVPVEADILLPADILLDLYGEDIRARAYTTQDPSRGELMLRPDFTVPLVQAHMTKGAGPARYCYLGPVFRQQDHTNLTSEYLQVGFEIFDHTAPEKADAEVFAMFADLLINTKASAMTGDVGILVAAVQGLSTTSHRKAALLRHVWRPNRFRALLDRFAGRSPVPPGRTALLKVLASGSPDQLITAAGPVIGTRTPEEIVARAKTLIEDVEVSPLVTSEADLLYDLLTLRAPTEAALQQLRSITFRLPAIEPAIDRFSARIDALRSRGIDTNSLPFEASLGRSSIEYYDGFTFSFLAEGLPPIVSGGRYDSMTRVLGKGRTIPAVGGIIRPALSLQVRI